MTRSAAPELTVLFDGGCPLCVREVTFLRGRDRRGALGFVDIDALDYDPRPSGHGYEEAMVASMPSPEPERCCAMSLSSERPID